MNEWHDYIAVQRKYDLDMVIKEERLKEEETYRFMENAFRDGEIRTAGVDIDKLMPTISRFGGGRAKKKQTVIEKLKLFFEKYFGIGSAFTPTKQNVNVYNFEETDKLSIAAEEEMTYGKK